MLTPWNPLLSSTLQAKAYRLGIYVAAGSWCQIQSQQKATTYTNEEQIQFTSVLVNAALTNLENKIYVSAAFVLPSEVPTETLSAYRVVYSKSTEQYEVSLKAWSSEAADWRAVLARRSEQEPARLRNKSKRKVATPLLPPPVVLPKVQGTHVSAVVSVPSSSASVLLGCPQPKSTNNSIADSEGTRDEEYYRSPTGFDWATLEEEDEAQASGPKDEALPSMADQDADPSCGSSESSSSPKDCSSPTTLASMDSLIAFKPRSSEDEEPSPAMYSLNLEGLPRKQPLFAPLIRSWDEFDSRMAYLESFDLDLGGECGRNWTQYLADSSVGVFLTHEKLAEFDRNSLVIDKNQDEETETEQDIEEIAAGDLVQMRSDRYTYRPNIRQYIPQDISAEFQAALDYTYPELLAQVDIETPRLNFAEQCARGIVEWKYMCRASQRLLASGQGRRSYLDQTDRSVDWFWTVEHANGTQTILHRGSREVQSTMTALFESEHNRFDRPIHHFNFSGQPVYYKSTTPPAVSLWAALSPVLAVRVSCNGSLARTVVSSEAGRYLDPFYYCGPMPIPVMNGTSLRDYVTGQVEKVYCDSGCWMEELLDMDDEQPLFLTSAPFWCHFNTPGANVPTTSYHVGLYDYQVPTINDDGRLHVTRHPRKECVDLPSMLRRIQNVEDTRLVEITEAEECPIPQITAVTLPSVVSITQVERETPQEEPSLSSLQQTENYLDEAAIEKMEVQCSLRKESAVSGPTTLIVQDEEELHGKETDVDLAPENKHDEECKTADVQLQPETTKLDVSISSIIHVKDHAQEKDKAPETECMLPQGEWTNHPESQSASRTESKTVDPVYVKAQDEGEVLLEVVKAAEVQLPLRVTEEIVAPVSSSTQVEDQAHDEEVKVLEAQPLLQQAEEESRKDDIEPLEVQPSLQPNSKGEEDELTSIVPAEIAESAKSSTLSATPSEDASAKSGSSSNAMTAYLKDIHYMTTLSIEDSVAHVKDGRAHPYAAETITRNLSRWSDKNNHNVEEVSKLPASDPLIPQVDLSKWADNGEEFTESWIGEEDSFRIVPYYEDELDKVSETKTGAIGNIISITEPEKVANGKEDLGGLSEIVIKSPTSLQMLSVLLPRAPAPILQADQLPKVIGFDVDSFVDLMPCIEEDSEGTIVENSEVLVDDWLNDFSTGKEAKPVHNELVASLVFAVHGQLTAETVFGKGAEIKADTASTPAHVLHEGSGQDDKKVTRENDQGTVPAVLRGNEQASDPEDASDQAMTKPSMPPDNNSFNYHALLAFGVGYALAKYGYVKCLLYGTAGLYVGSRVYRAFRG
ncbi:hypothetical protein MMC13_000938 [Lambiella insularis]|nr:hypothetical protein [Lambiella insularis]